MLKKTKTTEETKPGSQTYMFSEMRVCVGALCLLPVEKRQATRAGFEPAFPVSRERRLNLLDYRASRAHAVDWNLSSRASRYCVASLIL